LKKGQRLPTAAKPKPWLSPTVSETESPCGRLNKNPQKGAHNKNPQKGAHNKNPQKGARNKNPQKGAHNKKPHATSPRTDLAIDLLEKLTTLSLSSSE